MGETIRIRGRSHSILGRIKVRRREYLLLEELAQVDRPSWKAFDPLSGPGGQFFLIRRLPSSMASQRLRVFHRLKSRTLPTVVEWQHQRDHIDVVLTWSDGIPLTEAFEHIRAGRRPPIAPAQVVRLINGLVHAVTHLHRRLQTIHGDIQPANVVISDHPSHLHLIDFGSAWTMDWTWRRHEGDGHHRNYAAPELQVPNSRPTSAADQFSVAVIAYQMLTGQLPWGGLGGKAGRPEYVTQVTGNLVPPSTVSDTCRRLPDSVREPLDTLVTQSLALDPSQRISPDQEWLNRWQKLNLQFQLPPQSSRGAEWLSRVLSWLAGQRAKWSRP